MKAEAKDQRDRISLKAAISLAMRSKFTTARLHVGDLNPGWRTLANNRELRDSERTD